MKTNQPIDFKAMASQLAKPDGAEGIKMAERMNENNEEMNLFAVDALSLTAGQQVLEIGPANGKFASYILDKAENIRYTGADISETMIKEANKLNADLIKTGKAVFILLNGDELPFMEHTFDQVFTVNTLYFWKDPVRQLAEIRRVLKPAGVFCLAIGSKQFMQQLPFTTYGFTLYSADEAELLLTSNGFTIINTWIRRDERTVIMGKELVKEQIFIVAIS